MKTIEERAANLAKEFATGKQNRETAVYKSCIRMATEQRKVDEEEFYPIMEENVLKAINKQKKIDIEKAEMNFCIFCNCYDNCDARYSCETFEKFCKVMEG